MQGLKAAGSPLTSRWACLVRISVMCGIVLGGGRAGMAQTAQAEAAPARATSDAEAADSGSAPLVVADEGAGAGVHVTKPDFNDQIYYRNKLEFSVETGVLWVNIPFAYDVFVGGNYSTNPLHYTLMPIFPSVRWHVGKISGPSILRGNTDITATLSITPILRGPEKIYGAFDLGFRRNFVQRNWRVAPYFEVRAGAGFIDAKERPTPGYAGNNYAQGEDYTFTLFTGAGLRYNFSPRYSMALGITYFHISNAYLSEPMWDDNGINVVGPWVGFNWRISKPKNQ